MRMYTLSTQNSTRLSRRSEHWALHGDKSYRNILASQDNILGYNILNATMCNVRKKGWYRK